MSNMRDVAIKAGVSVSTVSHVINETRFVSQETRSRVINAMEELNYQPNMLASSLRRKDKRTQTLGLLVPDSMNPFFTEALRGVEDACFAANYNVFLCNSENLPEKELEYLEVLISKQIDGIILISTGTEDSLYLLEQHDIPTVLVDRELGQNKFDNVIIDNQMGGQIAIQYLIKLNHTRIGCITGPNFLTPSAKRVHGYRKTLMDSGIAIDDALIVQGDFRPQSGYTGMNKLFALEDRPTAVFACNDLMAIGAIHAIHERRLNVPLDISVIGFDDIMFSSYTMPPLTTVAQPSYEMGLIAAERLINRLSGTSSRPRQEILYPTLVVRKSCEKAHV
jgi:LacI family transcriptional regulator